MRGGLIQCVHDALSAVVRLGDDRAAEGIGLDDVRPGFEVGAVDFLDYVRAGEYQQIVVALQVTGVVLEVAVAVVGLGESVALDEAAHGAVEDEDALGEEGS